MNCLSIRLPLFAVLVSAWILGLAANADRVTVREERLVLPTYLAGDPDPSPMFFFGRASQGAEGRIYPYPSTTRSPGGRRIARIG